MPMQMTTKQSTRIKQLWNDHNISSVTILPSEDLPDEELYVNFTADGHMLEGVLDGQGNLVTYDRDGQRVDNFTD